MHTSDLLSAATPKGVAFRENGLRNLEAALLVKHDWASQEEREQMLAQFYTLAARLRALDARVLSKATQQRAFPFLRGGSQ